MLERLARMTYEQVCERLAVFETPEAGVDDCKVSGRTSTLAG
jgi:hypothetical protein